MQRLAGDVSRVWRKQELNRRSDIFGAADAAERNVLDEEADDTALGRGAAAAALKELYGAPWSTTGPARPRNSTTETGREAE